MQFQVPQFIEVEDKIFGPLTIKQFVYLAGAAGGAVVFYLYIPWKIIGVLLALPLIGLGVALAFYKRNGRPFIDTVESAFYYYFGDKLYIWRKEDKKPEKNLADEVAKAKSLVSVPKMSESKLKDLTWSLDIKENVNPVTRDEE